VLKASNSRGNVIPKRAKWTLNDISDIIEVGMKHLNS